MGECNYPLLKVSWSDSIQDNSGWVRCEEYDFSSHEESSRMESTGKCIKITDKTMFLAQSYGNGQINSIISIPVGCILSIIVLRRE